MDVGGVSGVRTECGKLLRRDFEITGAEPHRAGMTTQSGTTLRDRRGIAI